MRWTTEGITVVLYLPSRRDCCVTWRVKTSHRVPSQPLSCHHRNSHSTPRRYPHEGETVRECGSGRILLSRLIHYSTSIVTGSVELHSAGYLHRRTSWPVQLEIQWRERTLHHNGANLPGARYFTKSEIQRHRKPHLKVTTPRYSWQ